VPYYRGMKHIPAILECTPDKFCFTYAELAAVLHASERFVQEKVRWGGLRVRLLRPGLPRIAVFDFEDWIARQKRRARWPHREEQVKCPATGSISNFAQGIPKGSQPRAFLTLTVAAEALSVSYETVRTLIRYEGLPVVMMASRVPRLDPFEIEAWIKARPLRAAKCPNPATRGRRPSSKLRESVYVDLPGGGWAANAEAQPEAQVLNLLP
jgi:hypothetical protein